MKTGVYYSIGHLEPLCWYTLSLGLVIYSLSNGLNQEIKLCSVIDYSDFPQV